MQIGLWWALEKEIQQFWASSSEAFPLKLVGLDRKLKDWSRTIKRNKQLNRKKLEAMMHELYEKYSDDDILNELTKIQLDLNLEADKEKLFWG